MKKRFSLLAAQYNWRALLVRLLVDALVLALVAGLTPQIYFIDKRLWVWLVLAAGFGVLSAIVKPLLQAVTLRFVFASYGLVVALVNVVMLYLLAWIFPQWFAVGRFLWALLGGILMALLSVFLDGLFGLTRPIVPESEEELSQRLKTQDRSLIYTWFKTRQPTLVSADTLPPMNDKASGAAPAGSSEKPSVSPEATSATSADQQKEGER